MGSNWPLNDTETDGETMDRHPFWVSLGVFILGGLAAAQWLSEWATEPWVYGGTHCASVNGVLACGGVAPIGLAFIVALSVVLAQTVAHNYRIWKYDEPEVRDADQ